MHGSVGVNNKDKAVKFSLTRKVTSVGFWAGPCVHHLTMVEGDTLLSYTQLCSFLFVGRKAGVWLDPIK